MTDYKTGYVHGIELALAYVTGALRAKTESVTDSDKWILTSMQEFLQSEVEKWTTKN